MSDAIQPLFIGGGEAGEALTAELAGSKAAQLWRMTSFGLPVPPAFVLPTTLCAPINAGDLKAREVLRKGLDQGIAWLEQVTGRGFGDSRRPLLVSVRSGAAASMPGMLDTVLNVGLNGTSVRGLLRLTGNPRLAFDSYRRLVQDYAEVVEGARAEPFAQALEALQRREGTASEDELDPDALEQLAATFRDLAEDLTGKGLPEAPRDQLEAAALAVYRSWESERAKRYRRINRLDGLSGTAVTVQAMVFGNAGASSGAGVAFSRNPASGAKELYVDLLFDAQGEDVVSGRRTPAGAERLAARLPAVAQALGEGVRRIEREVRDAQDVEFTFEEGRLFFLQTRTAKRAPRAALRIAVDLVHEGMIDPPTALARLQEIETEALSQARFADAAAPLASAIGASPGVASGRIALDSQRAMDLAQSGEPVILVRPDTSTEDLGGFEAAAGILTAVGGRTAHAAVVARQLGKVCLVGCRDLVIDEAAGEARIGEVRLHGGDWLSLDGDSGEVTLGRRAIVSEPPPELAEIERWRSELPAG